MATEPQKEYQREYYKKNKEKVLSRQRKKRTPEVKAAQRAQYKERYANDADYRERIKVANRLWRKKHPEQRRQITQNQRAKKQAIVDAARRNASCSQCGESHPACLDFHHRDPNTKEHRIAVMGSRGLRPETIYRELAKCDVLCANCHRKLHWEHKWQIAG